MHSTCSSIIALLAIVALITVSPAVGDEPSSDLARSRELTVGNTKVTLLKVNQTLDYTADAKRTIRSLEVWYLVEQLDDAKIGGVQSGLEAMAAGTKDTGVRFLGPSEQLVTTNENYEDYEKRFYAKLPPVRAKDRAVVMFQALRDIELTAKKLDLKLRVGLNKMEKHTIWFKGVSFE